MTIEFDIPNGHIRIHAETFFESAGMAQIRRMFKMLWESGLDDSRRKEILVWLRDHATEMHQRAADWAGSYEDRSTRYKELEELYERMKSPCYAEYTQDKKALKAAWERVASVKQMTSACKREYQTVKKMEDRYQKIIDVLVETTK